MRSTLGGSNIFPHILNIRKDCGRICDARIFDLASRVSDLQSPSTPTTIRTTTTTTSFHSHTTIRYHLNHTSCIISRWLHAARPPSRQNGLHLRNPGQKKTHKQPQRASRPQHTRSQRRSFTQVGSIRDQVHSNDQMRERDITLERALH